MPAVGAMGSEPGGIPAELRERKQWLVWVSQSRGGKPTKVPLGSSTDRTTWRTYKDVVRLARSAARGIGFVFTAGDPYVGIDLDHCVQDGAIHPAARELIDRFDSYWEFSPSGEGAHIIVRGTLPDWCANRTSRPWGGSLEVYEDARFFTMTGHGGGEIAERTAELEQLTQKHFRRRPPERDFDWERTPAEGEGFPGSDEELLAGLREDPRFVALYEGRTGGDHSRADFELCCRLAELTGDHPRRIESLWCDSALAQREKWEREDYRQRTIARAIAAVVVVPIRTTQHRQLPVGSVSPFRTTTPLKRGRRLRMAPPPRRRQP